MNEFVVTINGNKRNVKIIDETSVLLDDKKLSYELHHTSCSNYLLKIENKFYELNAEKINGNNFAVSLNGSVFETVVRTTLQERASKIIEQQQILHHNIEMKAPMPGMILKIKKQVGDKVEPGDSIIILEAMKMENDLRVTVAGTVKEIYVKAGAAVDKNAKLLIIE
ncbi:MAG: hypothetical protein K8H86_08085 [Ignavibacteriaceae bacterium]|nr:hypothetical protein [Ignavibacteriaceae bacterium]